MSWSFEACVTVRIYDLALAAEVIGGCCGTLGGRNRFFWGTFARGAPVIQGRRGCPENRTGLSNMHTRGNHMLYLTLQRLVTPIGEMLIVADREGNLRAVDWNEYEARMHRLLRLHYGDDGFVLEPTDNRDCLASAMLTYFAGELTAIDALPVRTGGTSFQREVWATLRRIPCGETISYAQLAGQINRPKAVRAVGLANGANPVGVVVPCHRVVGRDGALTGYGGGIERKSWLLNHEAICRPGTNTWMCGRKER